MLGDKLGHVSGDTTGMRVLSTSPPKMEVSYRAQGNLIGIDMLDTGTYHAELDSSGRLHGAGQGISMSAEGDVVRWNAKGVGHPTAGGGASYRGAIFYSTDSERLARLNGACGVFEFEASADGKVDGTVWEWK